MTAYWIYSRLGVHVTAKPERVREAMAEWADRAVVGGREKLTEEHYAAVLKEHDDAFALFAAVQSGRI